MTMRTKWTLGTIIALSSIGFVDALYLTIKRFAASPVVCYVASGCDKVAQSAYDAIGGIPTPALGALFYAATVVVVIGAVRYRSQWLVRGAKLIAVIGGLFSLYLLGMQAFVIHAWCFYCIVSDTIGVINALLVLYLLKRIK